MTASEITYQLNTLANLQAERDVINLEKQDLINKILTPEIRAQIAEVEAEFAPRIVAANNAVDDLTEYIEHNVIEAGESVKGDFLHAVYAKGRVSWDTKALDGYAVAHPEIKALRKQGKPSVSIRKV